MSAPAGIAPSRLRERVGDVAVYVILLAATALGLAALVALVATILNDGMSRLTVDFLNNMPSRRASKAGFHPAILGSLWLMGIVIAVALPIGVAAALYLQELAPKNRWTRIVESNISNLAGVPSIVYGILGLAFFARKLGLGFSVLTGGLTMSLLVLPVVIIATREALRAVPDSIRRAALGLGATRWQAVRTQVLPAAAPGILTGCILAISRAIGETAPLLLVGAVTFVTFDPTGLDSRYSPMPMQILSWIQRPQADFRNLAAAGIIVLLMILLSMNAVAIALRSYFEKKKR